MGSTYLTNYRNWNIPGAEAPANMIAPMWDDLYQSGNNRVCYWSDAANHRYIVEWSRLINNNGGATETFEAILLDPAYYPTDTGDGVIEFQYDQFTNCDYQQHYSTVGIQNGNRDDGIMYSYYNYYGPGGATLGTGRAIRFTPIEMVDPAALPDGSRRPTRLALYPPQPNPLTLAGGGTALRFDLPAETMVHLGIYDVGGRLVRGLVDGPMPAGSHTVAWNGADPSGERVAGGVYFTVLRAGGKRFSERVLIIR
jgi:hypothetical protein